MAAKGIEVPDVLQQKDFLSSVPEEGFEPTTDGCLIVHKTIALTTELHGYIIQTQKIHAAQRAVVLIVQH